MTAERTRCGWAKSVARLGVAIVHMAACSAVSAQTLEWAIDLGAGHSDNVGRTVDNEESETIATAGVAFVVESDRPRLDADIAADLQYQEYLDDTFESEVVGGLNGAISYAFLPERFTWIVEDNFGQIANQRQVADSPANRQNFNYFTTGPDVTIPIGGRTQLELSGRWSDVYFEDGSQDSQALLGAVALLRRISETGALSLNGSVSETEFDEETQIDKYEIQEGFVRYALNASRTELTADAGYTVLRQAGESSDGLLARLGVTRRVAARSQVGFQAGTEFSTSADTFRRDQTIIGVDVGAGAAVASSDAFQTDYAYLTWSTDWVRSAIAFELSARKEEHELLTALDREQLSANVLWSRQLLRSFDLDLRAGYLDEKFVESGFQFDEWSAGAALSWQLSRRFALQFSVDHFEGSGEGGGRNYEENRAFVGVSFGRAR